MNTATANRWSDIGWPVGVVLTIFLVWEGGVRLFDVPDYVLPTVTGIIGEFFNDSSYYLDNMAYTLGNTLIGFTLAIIVGVSLAVGIVSSRILDRIFMTILALVHSVPKVALAPLLVIWLGTGGVQKIVIAMLASVFIIVIDAVVGMRSIDPELISMARVKRASGLQILLKLRLPQALPNIFGALKAAAAFSLIGSLVGEFVGGEKGLGYVILVAQGMFETTSAFVAVILLGITGTGLYYIVNIAEAKLLPWHVSQRQTGRA